jgi:DNA-binding NarL/FixJ family response regulator
MNDHTHDAYDADGPGGPRPDRRRRSPVRVVIVDDHLLVADSIAAALDAQDDLTVVEVATTCADGLAAVGRHNPDVLLLDQRLPDGLGTDVLPSLLDRCPSMKVLLVTASDSDDVLTRAIEAGAAGFIPKGERAANLVRAVRAAADDEAVITMETMRRVMGRMGRRGQRTGDDLTAREREVLQLLVDGKSTSGLADSLVVSQATARNHVQSIMRKLGAHSRLEAVAIATRQNILADVR